MLVSENRKMGNRGKRRIGIAAGAADDMCTKGRGILRGAQQFFCLAGQGEDKDPFGDIIDQMYPQTK